MRNPSNVVVAVVLVLLGVSSAPAAVFNIAAGDVPGLIAAIDAANANGEADTINLAAGAYALTTPQAASTGLPEITSEIDLIGAGAATTAITRTPLSPVFRLLRVTESGRLRVEGITVSGGRTTLEPGGAIRSDGTLTVVDCILSSNANGNVGGAIAHFGTSGGSLLIEGTELSSNSIGSNSGSALYVFGPFVLRGSQVTSNSSAFGGAVRWSGAGRGLIEDSLIQGNAGGGIATSAADGAILEVVRSTIDGNTIDEGMRLQGEALQVFISDTTISNNVSDFAGGIFVGTKVVLRRSTVSGNTSTHPTGGGGGIRVSHIFGTADLTVESSTITGNAAYASGGGIYVSGPLPRDQRVRIRGTTITDNTADSDLDGTGAGGGISALPGELDLVNSIVAGNVDQSGTANDCAGPIASQGHNLIGDAAGCGIAAAPGDVIGAGALLGPLAANGGPTATHLPLAGSPALDAADPASCGAPDQRFFARPVDGDGDAVAQCDIGAVEAGSATPVVFLADHFLCYGARTSQGTAPLTPLSGVSLVDDVEGKDFDVRKSTALCTPGDADGLGIVDDATHLHARMIKETVGQPRHTKQLGLVLVNALGAFRVDTVRPDSLLVPASKGLDAFLPAPDPMDHDLDRYKCYRAKTTLGAPKLPRRSAALRVALSNQFSDRAFALNKVTKVCTAVDEEGQGRKNPAAHLLCFQARTVKPLAPNDVEHIIGNLHLASEWGTEQLDAKRSYELCVPSLRIP